MALIEPDSDQLAALEQFAWGKLPLEQMQAVLSKRLGSPIRQNEKIRAFSLKSICPFSRIHITRAHLESVLAKRRRKEITDQDLVDWATMLMINDAYFWDADDDILAGWINHFHLDLPC